MTNCTSSIKVLVSGASGDVGQGVIKALLLSGLNVEIYATCTSIYSSWLYHESVHPFPSVPVANDAYLDFLIDFILEHSINVFIPTIDSEIPVVARAQTKITEVTGAHIFIGSACQVDICNDKYLTAKFLSDNNFPSPKTYLLSELKADDSLLQPPFIVKPRAGNASKDITVIRDRWDITPKLLGKGDQYIAQELLSNEQGEYTSGIYIGDDQQVKGICSFKRKLSNGRTILAQRVINAEHNQQLAQIALKLGLKYLNIQAMCVNNNLIPFEFNGRLSGTTSFVNRVFNAPSLFIRERYLSQSVPASCNDELFVAMRYYDEIIASPEQVQAIKRKLDQLNHTYNLSNA